MKLGIIGILIFEVVFYFAEIRPPEKPKPTQPEIETEEVKTETVKPAEPTPEQKAIEEKKIADAKEAELKAQEQKTAAEEMKAKAEREAKEEAEEAKNNADAQARLATIRDHLLNLSNISLATSALNPEIKQMAIAYRDNLNETSKKYKAARNQLKVKLQKLKNEQHSLTKASDRIRIGWRWTDCTVVRPMSELPRRRAKPVKYIYSEYDKRDIRVKELQEEISILQADYDSAKTAIDRIRDDYSKLVSDYKNWLTNELARLECAIK